MRTQEPGETLEECIARVHGVVRDQRKALRGECNLHEPSQSYEDHPLFPVLIAAIQQCMFGKGERHGGAVTPFLEQPWRHYAQMHGRGFLTGQAAKKLEEAASTREGKAFEQEVLGAIVYCGMALIYEREKTKETQRS